MELLIRFFAALLLDILAYDFFIAMTSNSTDKVAFGPEFPTPQLLFDCGHSFKHFARRNAFDGLHNLRRTIRGNRLNEKVHVVFIRADLQENNRIPFGDVQTDLFEYCIDFRTKHNPAILGRTDDMVDQDGNVVPLMTIVTHASDGNISEEAEASFEESDPRD